MNAPTMRHCYLDESIFLTDYIRAYLEAIDSTFVNRPWAWVRDTEILWRRRY
jgi:hypothetical protein